MVFKLAFTGKFKDCKKNVIMYRFVSLITLIFNEHSVCFETGLKSFKGYFRPFTNIQFFEG